MVASGMLVGGVSNDSNDGDDGGGDWHQRYHDQ